MAWICNACALCFPFSLSLSFAALFFHVLSVYIADLLKALSLRRDALTFAISHLYAWNIFVNQRVGMEEEF